VDDHYGGGACGKSARRKLSPAEQSRRQQNIGKTPERKRPEQPQPMTRSKSPTLLAQDSLEEQLVAFRSPSRDESIPTFPSPSPEALPQDTLSPNEFTFEEKVPRQRNSSSPNLGLYDLTRPNPMTPLSSHVAFFINFDWASTELGPMSSWPNDLRRMVNIMLRNPRPAVMYSSKQRTMMYNEPYVLVAGQKHPDMMGKPYSEAWAEME
jgi:hypothetical protein